MLVENQSLLIWVLAIQFLFFGYVFLRHLIPKWQGFMESGKSILNLKTLAAHTPTKESFESIFPDDSQLSYSVEVPHQQGFYFLKGTARSGEAALIHAIPDMIVRLPYENAWTNSRFISTSQLCLKTDQKSNRVELIARGRRLQIDYNDDSIRSSDNHYTNCLVAFHWKVNLDLSETHKLNLLFDQNKEFYRRIQEFTKGLLISRFRTLTYKEITSQISETIQLLNDQYLGDSRFDSFRELATIQFTGLLIKPRIECEISIRQKWEQVQSRIKEDIQIVQQQQEAAQSGFLGKWNTHDQEIMDLIHELESTEPALITSESNSFSEGIRKVTGRSEHLMSQAAQTFQSGTLQERCMRLTQKFKSVAEFVRVQKSEIDLLLQTEFEESY